MLLRFFCLFNVATSYVTLNTLLMTCLNLLYHKIINILKFARFWDKQITVNLNTDTLKHFVCKKLLLVCVRG